MNSSESITKLAAALVSAQKEMKNPTLDKTNPHFKSKFASLAQVRETVLPILNKHGLSLTQFPKGAEGAAGCVNRLMHESGEWLEEECLLPLDRVNAQGAGSAITYARRYSIQAIAGVVADEDDDGNAASEPKQPLKGVGEESAKSIGKADWDAQSEDSKIEILAAVKDVQAKYEMEGEDEAFALYKDKTMGWAPEEITALKYKLNKATYAALANAAKRQATQNRTAERKAA